MSAPRGPRPLAEAKCRALAAFAGRGPVSVHEVARATGLSYRVIRREAPGLGVELLGTEAAWRRAGRAKRRVVSPAERERVLGLVAASPGRVPSRRTLVRGSGVPERIVRRVLVDAGLWPAEPVRSNSQMPAILAPANAQAVLRGPGSLRAKARRLGVCASALKRYLPGRAVG